MWTLIGRTAMNIFQREDSEFFFMKIFVKSTNPIIKMFKFILGMIVGGFIVHMNPDILIDILSFLLQLVSASKLA